MVYSKTSLILVSTLLVLCGCAQQPVQVLPPNSSIEPVEQDANWAVDWWLDRHQEKLQLARGADVELVMLGDSITHGWESEGADTWQAHYHHRKAFNLGFSGDRTEHVLWRLQHGAVDGMQPEFVVLMIGTNNTGHSMDPAVHTAAGITLIVDELRERLPMTKILLLAIFPRHSSPHNEMRLRNLEINQLIAALDDGDVVHFLDINHVFLNGDETLREDLMPDLLHPNGAGYEVWADAMEPAISRLLQ